MTNIVIVISTQYDFRMSGAVALTRLLMFEIEQPTRTTECNSLCQQLLSPVGQTSARSAQASYIQV